MKIIKQILVIEDNTHDFFLFKKQLEWAKIKADEIINVQTIKELEKIKSILDPDVIFTDLGLPDNTGLNTFLAVKTLFPSSPIIIFSGLDQADVVFETVKAGAQDFLLKQDITTDILIKTIQESIERKQNQLRMKESLERYEILSQSTKNPIWEWRVTTNEIIWDKSVHIFGYPAKIKKDYNWWLKNIHPKDRGRVNKKLEESLKGNNKIWNDNYRFKCFDYSYKYIVTTASIMRDFNYKANRMIGVMEDRTNEVLLQKMHEEQLIVEQKAQLQAVIENHEKEIKDIGDELQEKINPTMASVNLLLKSYIYNSREKDECLEQSVANATECIEEIRHLTKTLLPPDVRIKSFQEAVIDLAEFITTDSKLVVNTFITDTANKLAAKEQYYIALFRIIQDHLTVIAKYDKVTEVTIKLEKYKSFLVLTFTDDRKGMNVKKISSGISLTNIKNRTELLNGTLEITSTPDNGNMLKIQLPII
jgi:signal transduction histidine kinase